MGSIFSIILALLFFNLVSSSNYIHCPLVWKRASSGDGLPEKSVSTIDNGIHFVARVLNSSSYYGGRYEDEKVYIIVNGNEIISPSTFEVLTNPHGCILNWRQGRGSGAHDVKVADNSNRFIARGYISGSQFAGPSSDNNFQTVDKNNRIVSLSSFDILEAYSKGLTLEVTNFIFDGDFFGGTDDFLGIDQIHNLAEATVKQIISHKKTVIEKTLITNSQSWGHTFNAEFTIQPEFEMKTEDNTTLSAVGGAISLSYEMNYLSEKNEELKSEKETMIQVEREITVPGYTSVQICSTVKSMENFSFDYVARGRYSAPGLTGEEVKEILAKDKKSGEIQGNSVIVVEKGKFGGSLALDTKIIIADVDNSEGCSKIARFKTI